MNGKSDVRFVSLDEARAARGLRLVVAAGIPSPWSETAKGIFDAKRIDYVAVKFDPRDEALRAWTSSHNTPSVFFDDEPPRTGWAEILMLGERLGGGIELVPRDPDARMLVFGWGHEILGEGGLSWCVRFCAIHASLTTDGRDGFPLKLAAHLGRKYGYAPDRFAAAKNRVIGGLRLLSQKLAASRERGWPYLLGTEISALDIFVATTMGVLALMPPELCPMLPVVRHAFSTVDPELHSAVTPELIAHRDFVYERHLKLPVRI
jgi:glutathione S-transferase